MYFGGRNYGTELIFEIIRLRGMFKRKTPVFREFGIQGFLKTVNVWC